MNETRPMEELERLRRSQGWSQRDLASKSGVSPTTVYELETGRRTANPSTLRKLADALGVPVKKLEKPPRLRYLEQEAEHLDSLVNVAASARDALRHDRADYTKRFLELLDEGLRNAAESLHEAARIERGETKGEADKSGDDRLSALMREWETEKV